VSAEGLWDTAKAKTTPGNTPNAARRPSASRSPRRKLPRNKPGPHNLAGVAHGCPRTEFVRTDNTNRKDQPVITRRQAIKATLFTGSAIAPDSYKKALG